MLKFWLLPLLLVTIAVVLYFRSKTIWTITRKNSGLVWTIIAALVLGICGVYLLYGFNPNFF